MTLHVFVGPSLSGSDIVFPDSVVRHPPIAHGDLYRLGPAATDSVLIVDGLYQHTAPVRHKEILDIHATGVTMFGTASLGALRACELDGYGMRGLGRVYQSYASGRLTSDADVALIHGDTDVDYRVFSHALVSIIDVADRLVESEALGRESADRCVELARSLHFSSRSSGALLQASRAAGLEFPMAAVVDDLRMNPGLDIKRRDAQEAIELIVAGKVAHPQRCYPPLTSFQREWRLAFTPAAEEKAGPTKRQILAVAQLFDSEFAGKHTSHVLATLRAEDRNHGRPFRGHSPSSSHAVTWLAALTADELLERSLLTVDEVRSLDTAQISQRVLVRSFRREPGRLVYDELPPFVAEFARDWLERAVKFLRLNTEASILNPSFHPQDVPDWLIDETFMQMWQVASVTIEVLDRGFRSMSEFREQARPFFLAARGLVALAK